MGFTAVMAQMLVLFFIIILGFVARKLDIMSDSFDGTLSRLVLDVTLPCMIIASVLNAEQAASPQVVLGVMTYSFIAYAIVLAIALVLPIAMRAPKRDRGIYSFLLTFSNVGFMGFPILATIFGQDAILYGAVLNIPFSLLVFTAGVLMISKGEGSFKKRLVSNAKHCLSPAVISCIAAMIMALLGVHNLGTIGAAFDAMGNMTTPAALLIIGSSLAKYSPREMLTNPRSYITAFTRLLVIPMVLLFALRPFVSDPLILGVIVILLGMPSATNGLMLCLRYGGNLKVMTQGVCISTTASILTIPCLSVALTLFV